MDLIAAELLQNLGQAEKIILFNLVCDMYETGDIPNGYKINKTFTTPKKVGTNKCEDYRTISLTTHTQCDLKITELLIFNHRTRSGIY